MMFDKIDTTARDALNSSTEERQGVFPLGTPADAGPLIGWVRGPKPAAGPIPETNDGEPQNFVLTRQNGDTFNGQDSGFVNAETGNRIWLWTEGNLVVGREGIGSSGAIPRPRGAVALAFGLDPDNHLAFACYQLIRHPTVSDSGEMANLMVRLVHVSPVASVSEPHMAPQANSDTRPDPFAELERSLRSVVHNQFHQAVPPSADKSTPTDALDAKAPVSPFAELERSLGSVVHERVYQAAVPGADASARTEASVQVPVPRGADPSMPAEASVEAPVPPVAALGRSLGRGAHRHVYQAAPPPADTSVSAQSSLAQAFVLSTAAADPRLKAIIASVATTVAGFFTRAAPGALRLARKGATSGGGLPQGSGRSAPVKGAHRSIRLHLRFAIAAVVLLAGGIGGWAATTELSGAVIAMGQLVVDSNVKKIQHPFGGVITELNVRDGDRVQAGDILVKLDGTETRANLAIVSKALDELYAVQARDDALRDGAASVSFPPDLMSRVDDAATAELMKGERRLFETLVSAADGQKAQLKEQVAQLDEQVRGMEKQLEAKAKEIDWSAQELVGIRDLWKKKLVDFARVTTAERDAARLEGEHGALMSAIAETKGKVAEMQLRILQVDEDMRTDVGKELADVRGKISELVEKKVAAEDRLQRLDIRAPQSGVVHELEFHTVGGVIQPGATIMGVVPDTDALTAEIRIAPPEIDQLHVGQKAILRFLSFNQQTTPELNAELTLVSADVTTDPKTGANYYTARVKVAEADTTCLAGLKLMAGMPVEVFVQTSARTVISYLVRPIKDQVERAFRER